MHEVKLKDLDTPLLMIIRAIFVIYYFLNLEKCAHFNFHDCFQYLANMKKW